MKEHTHKGITHTNGVVECYTCRKLIVPERLAHLYQGKQYESKVILVK